MASRIVFTSLKDGDLEIYTMNVDGTDVRRLTTTPGYDGGPWWSPDGTKIVYRAYHPTDSAELADYRGSSPQSMVRPSSMEFWVMNADGSDQRQVTHSAAPTSAPRGLPTASGSSSHPTHKNPRSRNFDLFLVNLDGTRAGADHHACRVRRISDVQPRWAKAVWASNRYGQTDETNLFIADWRIAHAWRGRWRTASARSSSRLWAPFT